MTATLHAFADDAAPAGRLAAALGVACVTLARHRFPDGEHRVTAGETAPTALVYRTLADPDAKLVELLLAADALRRRGATRLVLVAPYLPYMRQDAAFAPGEAVSQQVIGRLLAGAFDAVMTVDPHLHRTPDLASVLPGGVAISAAATIAQALHGRLPADAVLIGPDEESRPWVAAVAKPLGLDFLVATKHRHGDRRVTITLPDTLPDPGRRRTAFLVDDLLSSGGTLIACAQQLRAAGATLAGAAVTHCLASADDLARLAAAGIAPLLACDSIPGPVASIPLAPALAAAIREHGFA